MTAPKLKTQLKHSQRMRRNRGWIVCAIVSLCLQSCSSLKPSSDGRRGLFDDLASQSEGSVPRRSNGVARSSHDTAGKGELRQEKASVAAERSEKKLKKAALEWPLKQVQVTSNFGKRTRDFHEGLDLKARSGTPIFAAQAGVVIYSGSKIRGYGKMVILKHKAGVATVYAHASKLLVHRGEKVKLGQKIAFSGKTGRVSGPHLHFEVRAGATAVDPLEFLPQPGTPNHVARIKPAQLGNHREVASSK